MKKNLNQLPAYKIYEYSVVLNPHEELRNRIIAVKQHFSDSFNTTAALFGKPQLTLVNFTQYELFEERILNRLRNIAMAFHPLKVELKDFGSFPTHTIFVNVTTKLPVQELTKKIRSEAQRLMKLDAENKPHFMLEPHITVAAKLTPAQYEAAWKEATHKSFTGRFIADGMMLLKRAAGEKKYQVAANFAFENLPVSITQGDLFS